MSGYNPESQVTMRFGLDHWVLFILPSAYVIMLSVPHQDKRGHTFNACEQYGALHLLQEHSSRVQDEMAASLSERKSNAGCSIRQTVNRPYFSVTQVTVNGSYVKTSNFTSLSEKRPVKATESSRQSMTNCGLFKELWGVCDTRTPEPVVSDCNLWLHVLSGELQSLGGWIAGMEGFRVIFTFHTVCSV